MSPMFSAQRIRRWMRSPWVTFSILIEAILIPAICVIWLIGKASENERAALQQAYTSVRQREGMIVRDQLLQNVERLQSELWNDEVTISDKLEIGWLLPVNRLEASKLNTLGKPDAASASYLDELRYLEQTFGSLAALEQIRFWLGEQALDGLKLSGNRNLKAYILLKAIELSSETSGEAEYVDLLRSQLTLPHDRLVSGSTSRLFLLNALLPHLSEKSWVNSQIRSEKLALELMAVLELPQIPESQSFATVGDFILTKSAASDTLWYADADDFSEWLLGSIPSSEGALEASVPFRLLQPGSLVTDSSPLAFVIDMGSPLEGWRLAGQLDESSLLSPARERILVYVWVGVLATVASVLFAIIGIGMVKNEITLAKLKNDLAATVSHELKTPIASVRILVDTLLEGKGNLDLKTQEYLELISSENERLGLLVEKFLTFSRVERGAVSIDLRGHDADDLVVEAGRIFRSRFTRDDYQLKVLELAGTGTAVLADRQIMLAALGNLLENAHKYSSEPREIEIGSRFLADQGVVSFEVRDNGEGISPVEQKKIFRKFYQPDRRLSNHRGGVGLGLSIVAYVAKLHGAKVELESDAGKGSLFRMLIPVYHAKDTDH